MKPAWEELGTKYEASSSVLIGDVDCTEHQDVCSKYGVQGYPTIKYFTQGSTEGEAYNGGRDIDQLTTFVKDTLEVKCDVKSQEGCTDKEKAFITKMQEAGAEKIAAQSARLQAMKGNSMAAELKEWLFQRINILAQLEAA